MKMKPALLIATADASIRSFLTRVLSPSYRVSAFDNGRDVATAFERQEYAAAVLNYRLPGLSGPDIVSGLRAAGRQTPVVLISGSGMSPEAIPGFKTDPGLAFLAKPFTPRTLLALLTALIDGVPTAE